MTRMKSIKLASLGLVSLCVVALGTATVQAANPEAKTNRIVKFVEDTTSIDPEKPEVVDPKNPEGPAEVVDPTDEGSGGNGSKAFNINWVSDFKFGEIKIAGSTMKGFAQPSTLNFESGKKSVGLANFLQVTDNTGTNAGWNVKVQGSEFFELNDAGVETATTLQGAKLTLSGGHVIGSADNTSLAPASSLAVDKSIISAQAVNVFSAATGKGQGTWSLAWGAKSATDPVLKGITVAGETATGKAEAGVELSVPVTAQPKAGKNYRSTLNWVLATTPEV